MEVDVVGRTPEPEATMLSERARLVRLCARLTGDSDAAEDLAQETLVAAWRHERALRDPLKRAQWLSGIARNLCRQWARQHGRELARRAWPRSDEDTPSQDSETWPADAFDLEVELERRELVELLDRALALLPPESRSVLVERYVHESPHAEIAARMGSTVDAVAKRVERGKLALRRMLTTELIGEAAAYGLIPASDDDWQVTRIWCPTCGRRRLLGRFAEDRELQLDCVGCLGIPRSIIVRGNVEYLQGVRPAELFEGIKGYKPALNRLLSETHAFFGRGIAGRTVHCPWCGGEAPLRTSPAEASLLRYIQMNCSHCGRMSGIGTVIWRALELPEGRAFWLEHGRIHMLPDREVEAAGGPSIVSSLESVIGSARLEVVFVRDTLEVIGVHGTSGE